MTLIALNKALTQTLKPSTQNVYFFPSESLLLFHSFCILSIAKLNKLRAVDFYLNLLDND